MELFRHKLAKALLALETRIRESPCMLARPPQSILKEPD
jgi:hypothetical protein